MPVSAGQLKAIANYRAKNREKISEQEKLRRQRLREVDKDFVIWEKESNKLYRGFLKTNREFLVLAKIEI